MSLYQGSSSSQVDLLAILDHFDLNSLFCARLCVSCYVILSKVSLFPSLLFHLVAEAKLNTNINVISLEK